MERLKQQITFLLEVDKLKNIYRQTKVTGEDRYENDAEHSWHLAMMAFILLEHSNEKNIDLLKVIKMVLIHDIVEIDAGDTFAYDDKGYEDKAEREQKAANRIFNILPQDQSKELFDLWEEFEKRETNEAKFATALDRLNPLLLNYNTGGQAWKKHDVKSEKVLSRNKKIDQGSEALWQYAESLIKKAVEEGLLKA
jgi:putative hydrolases of HD superfamily